MRGVRLPVLLDIEAQSAAVQRVLAAVSASQAHTEE
jgi:hypothetical protein